jgi:hypothetical protein
MVANGRSTVTRRIAMALSRWSAPTKASIARAEIVRIDKVFQARWQKRRLRAIRALDEPAQ